MARQHGTVKAYNAHGCRCPTARWAHARDEKQRRYDRSLGRPRSEPAHGTVRRLRALMAIGWPAYELAARLGLTSGEALLNLTGRRWVRRVTADRVRRLYAALEDTPGPSATTRRRAAVKGWLGPAWLDGDRLDDPTYSPTAASATDSRSNRREDVAWLRSQGLADWEVAARLGVTVGALERADYRRREAVS